MAVKGWGYGTTPHITLVSEDDGTFTLYDGVSRMEDLDFADATSALEEEAEQPGGARFYITKSWQCIEYWKAVKADKALHPNNPRRGAHQRRYYSKWQEINRPKNKPKVNLADLGL